MSENTPGSQTPDDPFAAKPYVPPVADQSEEPTLAQPAAAGVTEPTIVQPAAEEPTVTVPRVESFDAPPPPPAPPAPSAAPAQPDLYTHRYTDAPASDPTVAVNQPAGSDQPPFPPVAPVEADGHKPRKRRGGLIVTGALIAGLVGGVGGAAAYDALNDDSSGTSSTVSSLQNDAKQTSLPEGTVSKVASTVLPSVVQINVKGTSEAGSGTGIIISNDGQILTNNHVVEVAANGGSITVSFNDGTTAKATIVGRDPITDLAVISAEGKSGLTPATLGTSDNLTVGQEVVAIGSPFGLESTVTSGIVSALNRPVTSSDGTATGTSSVFPAIQTDAAINPGNSGGPLVDLDGRVVGINSAIRTNSDTSGSGSIGLGFAIPIDLAKRVSAQLVRGETVEHARIGISVGDSVQADGLTSVGAEVSKVTAGSAGEKAGLKVGDVVTSLNGNQVASADGLVAGIRAYEPGTKVTLQYTRDGKTETTEVTLDSDGGQLSKS
ncbi:MAG: trypsin [Nocardioidaceae bacterium]|nr:trypsin [Nocardioidaceae bacterium]